MRKRFEAQAAPGNKRAHANKQMAEFDKTQAAHKESLKSLKKRFKEFSTVNALIRHQGRQGLVDNEYYYPERVGRHGRRKGVHRGTPVLKTTTSGQQFATPKSMIFSGGTDALGWKFNFAININYLTINDINRGWHSWINCILAFNNAMQSVIRDQPAILDYLRAVEANVPAYVNQRITLRSIGSEDLTSNILG